MSDSSEYQQLQMVWPEARLETPPPIVVPPAYSLRTYRPGDETRFYEVMDLAGWPGWDDERLRPWKARILPAGWFMAVHEASAQIAATAMCLHSHEDDHPFGAELGWVAGDPAHKGRGLGRAVCAAATARMIDIGYRSIHLYTEDWRPAALRIYLTIGYVPYLYTPAMLERWQAVCAEINWPFTPENWRQP